MTTIARVFARFPAWVLVALAWSVFGALRGVLRWAISPTAGGSLGFVVASSLLQAAGWAALTAGVIGLTRRVPWARPRARALAVHAAGALAAALIDSAWTLLLVEWRGLPAMRSYGVMFLVRLDWNLFTYATVSALTSALDSRVRRTRAGRRRIDLETRLRQAELETLSRRLQPHFLFNTLNVIGELVHRDPAVAVRTVDNLRLLLRRALSHVNAQEIPFREELDLLRRYIEIQRLRFGAALEVELRVTPEAADVPVPPMVLQPLVENAIRHGLERRGGGSVVVCAAVEASRLVLDVRDDGIGPPGAARNGQGLTTTRRRLQALYGDAADLRLGRDRDETVARVMLPMPCSDVDSEPPEANRRPPRLVRSIAVCTLLWAAYGVFWWQEQLAMLRYVTALGADPPVGPAGVQILLSAALWGPLSGTLVWTVLTGRLRRLSTALVATLHATAATALAGAHWLTFRALGLSAWDGYTGSGFKGIVADLFIYAAVAGASHAWDLTQQAERDTLRAADAERQLPEAELELIRWRIQPESLDAALAEIASAAVSDADRADELTAELGDRLRALIEAPAPVPA
jgi:hypothetical protein